LVWNCVNSDSIASWFAEKEGEKEVYTESNVFSGFGTELGQLKLEDPSLVLKIRKRVL